VVELLHSRLSLCGIQALALAALLAAIRSHPVGDEPKWFAPCGTEDNRNVEPRLVYRNWVVLILSLDRMNEFICVLLQLHELKSSTLQVLHALSVRSQANSIVVSRSLYL
jgi:hypothetical protein